LLLENKRYIPTLNPTPLPTRDATPPWRIGWYGALRCQKSLSLLCELVRRSEGKVMVQLAGRPALGAFEDFHRDVAEAKGVTFLGAYTPDMLDTLYRDVHFSWAIDRFEEGLNSSWLLPNRLYEGGMAGVVPIVEADVESGRKAASLGIGVALQHWQVEELLVFFEKLTIEHYARLESAVQTLPKSHWACDDAACQQLVSQLRALL
jgi:hypothetical protein